LVNLKKPNNHIKDIILIGKTIQTPGNIGLIVVDKQYGKKTYSISLLHKLKKVIHWGWIA